MLDFNKSVIDRAGPDLAAFVGGPAQYFSAIFLDLRPALRGRKRVCDRDHMQLFCRRPEQFLICNSAIDVNSS
jgi:hypothetical protein